MRYINLHLLTYIYLLMCDGTAFDEQWNWVVHIEDIDILYGLILHVLNLSTVCGFFCYFTWKFKTFGYFTWNLYVAKWLLHVCHHRRPSSTSSVDRRHCHLQPSSSSSAAIQVIRHYHPLPPPPSSFVRRCRRHLSHLCIVVKHLSRPSNPPF